MNWEAQLITEQTDDAPLSALTPRMLEVRNLCRNRKYGMALEILWDMLLTVRGGSAPEQEAFVLIHMGKVYRNWMWDVALKYFKEGLALAENCGWTRGTMVAHDAIAELHVAWKEPDKALVHYQQGLAAAERANDGEGQRDILLDMVLAYEQQGDFAQCDRLLDEARHLDGELDCSLSSQAPVMQIS